MKLPLYPKPKQMWRVPLLLVCPVLIVAVCFPDAGLTDAPGLRAAKFAWLRYRMRLGSLEGRQNAIWALGRMGPRARAAIPSLKVALYGHGPEAELGDAAAYALARMGTNGLPILLEAVRSGDRDVASRAASGCSYLIEQMGTNALPLMLAALRTKDPEVRNRVILSFSLIGAPAVPALVSVFRDQDAEAAQDAGIALRWLGLAAFPALEAALQDEDPAIRLRAASALKRWFYEGEDVVSNLVRETKARKPEWRFNAVMDLRHVATTNAIALQALLDALRDEHPGVRRHAAIVLSWVGHPAVPPLLAMLRTERREVKHDAAFALGLMRPAAAEAVPDLIQMLRDGAGGGTPLTSTNLGPHASRALGMIGKAGVPSLLDLLKDPDASVQRAALEVLGNIGPNAPDALPVLAAKLADPQQSALQVPTAAAWLKIDANSPAAAERLLAAARGRDVQDRALALEAFGAVTNKSPVMLAELLRGLADPTWRIRAASGNGLSRLGKAAVPYLVNALEDPDLDLRREATRLLQIISPESLKAAP